MRAWWLYKQQPDPDSTVPVVMIVFLYVIAVAMGLAIRALTGLNRNTLRLSFCAFSYSAHLCCIVASFTSFIFHDANIHYAETRKFIAKSRRLI